MLYISNTSSSNQIETELKWTSDFMTDFITNFIASPEAWLSLLMLSTMEIVLGIDNLIFVSILAGRLPRGEQDNARRVGMAGAFMTRLALLAFISWIVHWTEPLFSIGGQEFSGKSIIL